MRRRLLFTGLFTFLALLALAVGQPADAGPGDRPGSVVALAKKARRGKRRPPKKRYISSQAYYHAMQAELAKADGDLNTAAEELQLAIVYDAESAYLLLQLAQLRIQMGRLQKAEKLIDRALAQSPKDVSALTLKAKVQAQAGQPVAAAKSLRAAIALEPASIEASLALAGLLQKSKKLGEAVRVLRRAAQRAPQTTAPLQHLARIEVERRRFGSATRALARAVRRDPRDLELVTELSGLHERLGKHEAAVQLWRQFVEQNPENEDALINVARAELWNGHDDLADQYVMRLLSRSRPPDGDKQIGMMYVSEGRFSKGSKILSEVLEKHPSDLSVRFALAVALSQFGETDAALSELGLIGPDSALYIKARIRICYLLMGIGRLDRAALAARVALEKRADSDELITLLALIQERRGHTGDALRTLREARAKSPSSLGLMAQEGAILMRQGERATAVALFKGRTDPEALYHFALLLADGGDAAQAIELVKKVIRQSPDSSKALNFLGFMWADQGENLDKAEKLIRRALFLEPRSAATLDSLGWVRFRRKKPKEAERLLRRAARLTPRDPEVAEHLGDVRLTLNDRSGAKESYRRAVAALERAVLAKEPNALQELSRVQEKLERLR